MHLRTRLTILPLALALCASALASPPSAKTLLSDAESRGRAEHKNVLVLFHASWCHWCDEIRKVMDKPDIKPILDQNFEIVWLTVLENDDKKADENPGGADVLASMGGTNQGIPFYGILDDDGKTIVTSMEPQAGKAPQNIGCPSEPAERAYFRGMLKQSAPGISDSQLTAVDQAFADRAAERTVEASRLKHLGELLTAKSYDAVLKEADSLTAQYPAWAADSKSSLNNYRLKALLQLDPNKAYDMAMKAKGSPEELSFSLTFIAEPGREARFYDYAVEVLTAKCEASKKSPYLSSLAKAYSLDGNPTKAVDLQQQYIANIKELIAARPELPQATKDKVLADLAKELQQYQTAAAAKKK